MVTPEVVQVVPHDDYMVEILFQDGKIVHYDVSHLLVKNFLCSFRRTTKGMEEIIMR